MIALAAIFAVTSSTVGLGLYGVRLVRTTSDLFVASRAVTLWWNAAAISGEYLSAASFLGIAGLEMKTGVVALWLPLGYTAGYLAVTDGVSPIVATVAGICLSAACALILSAVTLRLRGLYLALATLAFGLLVDSLTVGLVDITGGPSGLVGIPSFSLGPIEFSSPACTCTSPASRILSGRAAATPCRLLRQGRAVSP